MAKGRIAVIHDQGDLMEELRTVLEREYFDVVASRSAIGVLEESRRQPPDALIVGHSPRLDGLDLCRRLRSDPRTAQLPILLLSSGGEGDRVAALEAGADDCLAVPVGFRELVARLKAVLRRSMVRAHPEELIQVGELVIDVARHRMTFRGRPLTVTVAEFSILRFMSGRPGRVLRRSEIISEALGKSSDGLSRTIDVHMAAIRRKLGRNARFIETVRGIGYRLVEPAGALVPAAGREH